MLFCIYWEDHMILILSFINMVYHVDWFANIEPPLQPWNKSHLIVMNNSFNDVHKFLKCSCYWPNHWSQAWPIFYLQKCLLFLLFKFFDFSLTEKEMKDIVALNKNVHFVKMLMWVQWDHLSSTDQWFGLSEVHINHKGRSAWLAESVKPPTLSVAQVMISRFVGLGPASDSTLTLEPAWDSLSLSLCPSPAHALSLCLNTNK